jgi:hypothetical protein
MIRIMVTRLVTPPASLLVVGCASLFVVLAGSGCEPEIGSPCSDNEQEVNDLVPQVDKTNNLVNDVKLENCSQALCLSFQGSRPFCTKRCEAELECAEAGAGFTCTDVVTFGPLACLDYEDPFLPQPGTEPSGEACEVDADCTVENEFCFTGGDLAGTCGTPGRDCLTGPDGGKSEAQLRYCAAEPDVIAARDEQFRPE